jgi:lysyl oxidase
LSALTSCLPKLEVPPDPVGTRDRGEDAGIPAAPCGGLNQVCCSEPARSCEAQLRCDVDQGTCVPDEQRLCLDDTQCQRGQRCCPAGLLSRCATLEPAAECPRPDLVITTTQEGLISSLFRDDRVFSPESSVTDRCAIEKRCVRGPGPRRLLRFTLALLNQGDADLILGVPGMTPGFETAVCDGKPYLPDYVRYELVDLAGNLVRDTEGRLVEGHVSARCQDLPAGFSASYDCNFWGLWRDSPEVRAPSEYDPTNSDSLDCQWLDITGVETPGDYVLRATVNPSGLLRGEQTESPFDFTLRLPALDDPTQSCPSPTDAPLVGSTGTTRECGWTAFAPAQPPTCVPGEPVTVGCPGCEGDPMLRICDPVAGACNAGTALGAGDETWGAFTPEDTLLGEYTLEGCIRAAQASGAGSRCDRLNICPTVDFVCPPSGSYSSLIGPSGGPTSDGAESLTCVVTPQDPAAPGANGSL